MSHDELHMSVVDGKSIVPYVSVPPSASVHRDTSTIPTSGLRGDALFRDLVAFVNPGSGGRQGPALIRDLGALIGADRVFTIGKVNGVLQKPIDYLQKVVSSRITPLRVVVCGGDGSVAWVISDADELVKPHSGIQIFIIPLGTGNDLARAMFCGGGYTGRNVGDLRTVLQRCLTAEPVLLDRWQLCFEPSSVQCGTTLRRQVFNYFSLGVDARIAQRFHQARESNPRLFCAQSVNQLVYGCCAGRQLCDCLPPIDAYADLYVDGQIFELPYNFKVCMKFRSHFPLFSELFL
jgi:diacylglycerol kinase (ATP)